MDAAAGDGPDGGIPRAGADPAWITPGAYEVAPGVHRIPLPLPSDALRAVNVYAIEDEDGLALIDSGWALAVARDALETALAGLRHKLSDVTRFLITHLHRDHYTQAVTLRREFGSLVCLGIGERPSMELVTSGGGTRVSPHQRRLRACGAGVVADRMQAGSRRDDLPDSESPYELPDEWLVPGDITVASRVLKAIPTPGHTRGHLCFRDAAGGLLFAGDHVLPHITPSIGFEPAVAALPLRDYLDSLRLIRKLPDTLLLPAHGPAAPSAHARVDELLAHHAARLEVSEQAVGAGATAYEVAGQMTWTRRQRRLDELDPFNQMLAVLETAAHLDLLVLQGRLRALVSDGVTGYVPR
jgi:glyoxylase-like metal-dependent hydrolase (beta-lactamase superfamily II)